MRSLQNQIGWCAKAQWALTAVAAAGGVMFFAGLYRPRARHLAELRGRADALRQALDDDRRREQELTRLRAEVYRLRDKTGDRAKAPAKPADYGRFMYDIAFIGQQQCHLGKWDTQYGLPRRGELFGERAVKLSFEGNFLEVDSFLRQVEDLPRLTRLKSLSLAARDSRGGVVEARLVMNLYFSE